MKAFKGFLAVLVPYLAISSIAVAGEKKVPVVIAQAQVQEVPQQATPATSEPVVAPEPKKPQTPDELIQAIWKQDAKFAQCILKGENAGKNPRAENKNRDGSLDRGIFQINSRTWPGYTTESFDKAFDAELNIRVAHEIFKKRGVKPWYGQKCK